MCSQVCVSGSRLPHFYSHCPVLARNPRGQPSAGQGLIQLLSQGAWLILGPRRAASTHQSRSLAFQNVLPF